MCLSNFVADKWAYVNSAVAVRPSGTSELKIVTSVSGHVFVQFDVDQSSNWSSGCSFI